jgi:hypothetical protein
MDENEDAKLFLRDAGKTAEETGPWVWGKLPLPAAQNDVSFTVAGCERIQNGTFNMPKKTLELRSSLHAIYSKLAISN